MEPDQNRRLKRKRAGPAREGRPGKLVRQPTMTLSMQARMRERQMRKRRQEGSRLRASDVESGMGGYMTGGQAKIAAKAPPPNKIDAKDFAVLRAEKAKGRGQGLQDEKLKPGKVMKADKGKMIKNDPVKTVNPFAKVPMKKASTLPSKISKAAKASKYGKIALGVAGIALAAKAGLEKMYEKRTGKKPFTKRPAKKMGGGMMQRPIMGYKSGTMVKAKGCKLGRSKPTKLY
tara:strand:+ start:83 stop:778 length:696 start_codon:yes stop_codon:yes gene_type:complete